MKVALSVGCGEAFVCRPAAVLVISRRRARVPGTVAMRARTQLWHYKASLTDFARALFDYLSYLVKRMCSATYGVVHNCVPVLLRVFASVFLGILEMISCRISERVIIKKVALAQRAPIYVDHFSTRLIIRAQPHSDKPVWNRGVDETRVTRRQCFGYALAVKYGD